MEEISVIIPFYNGEKYIEKCLYSLINQTYSNIKIYCIDDGSTDNSKDIIKELMKSDKRINYLYKENGGVSSARNQGISIAKSKWITFVDVDDTLPKEAIQNYISDDMNNFDIIIGKTNIINQNNITTSKNMYEKTHEILDKNDIYESIFYNKDFTKYTYIDIPFSKLYNLDFIKKNNICFLLDLKYGEDVIFNIQAVHKARKIKFVDNVVYNYYINMESVSNKFDDKLIDNYEFFLTELKKTMENLKIYDLHKKEWCYYVFRQLIKYCKKYFFNKNNKNTQIENKKKYSELLKADRYSNALKYINIELLSRKQKVIHYCMMKNYYFALNILFKLKRG